MSFIPKPHEIYRHFKGNLYQVTAIAQHTETGEQLVVYQALYGDFSTYARPLAMFTEKLDRTLYPDAGQLFRFELQGPEAARQREESGPEEGLPVREREADADVPAGKAVSETVSAGGEEKVAAGASSAARGRKGNAETASPTPGGERRRTYGGSSVCTDGSVFGEFPEEAEQEELSLDPLVLEFLDSDTYEQRLNILAGLHHRITNDMINTMAIACDVEINDGDVEERYEALKTCLLTLERYECNRIR